MAGDPGGLKKGWTPTPAAFQRFLAWLDEGVDSRGEKYEEMRRRLVAYFERKRCLAPHDLADETLNRVSRRLEEAGTIDDMPPARYCYIVARYVFLEYLRNPDYARAGLASNLATAPRGADEEAQQEDERRLGCLERCLGQLTDADRALILDYYDGETRARIDRRRALAARLQITANALTIRACRIREKLATCVSTCLSRR